MFVSFAMSVVTLVVRVVLVVHFVSLRLSSFVAVVTSLFGMRIWGRRLLVVVCFSRSILVPRSTRMFMVASLYLPRTIVKKHELE